MARPGRRRAVPGRLANPLGPGADSAVSIPDDIFEPAKRLARRKHRSRSEVYAAALDEPVARHAHDEVMDTMNRVAGCRPRARAQRRGHGRDHQGTLERAAHGRCDSVAFEQFEHHREPRLTPSRTA